MAFAFTFGCPAGPEAWSLLARVMQDAGRDVGRDAVIMAHCMEDLVLTLLMAVYACVEVHAKECITSIAVHVNIR